MQPPDDPPARRTARLRIAVAVVLVVALGVIVWALRGGPSPAPFPPATTTPPQPSTSAPTRPAPTTSTTANPIATVAPPVRPRTAVGERTGFATGSGILGEDDGRVAADLDVVASTGARWVRFDFDWSWVQRGGPASFDWAAIDRVVNAAHHRGLDVVALPTYTPSWARPPGTTQKHPPTNPDDFARFVHAAALRYATRGVTVWEIWNEPNVEQFWDQPDPARYTQLLRVSAAALRSVAPGLTVLTGGLSPARDRPGSSLSPKTFLAGVYDAGGRDSFDAVADHPYTFPLDPTTRVSSNAFLDTRGLYGVMVAHGDGAKRIWATEVGAPTRGSGSVSERTQAQWVGEYYSVWNTWPYTGPMLWYSVRDTGTGGDEQEAFGVLRADGAPKPALAALVRVVDGTPAGPASPG